MHLVSCDGEYDWLQQWPVACTITAQILTNAGQEKEYIDRVIRSGAAGAAPAAPLFVAKFHHYSKSS